MVTDYMPLGWELSGLLADCDRYGCVMTLTFGLIGSWRLEVSPNELGKNPMYYQCNESLTAEGLRDARRHFIQRFDVK